MGKGRRNRQRRRRQNDRFVESPDLDVLADAIEAIETPEEFSRLIAQRPDLIGDEMLSHLEEVGRVPNFEAVVAVFRNLVVDARKNPEMAWQKFEAALADAEARGKELGDSEREIEALIANGDHDGAIDLAEQTLPRAIDLGLGVLVGVLHDHLATA
jgi:hypothetical protein